MIPVLVGALLPVLSKVLDKVIPDTAAREQAKAEISLKLAEQEGELMKALIQSDVAQAEINKVEAASSDKFRSYPRPTVMWIAVIGLGWNIIPVMVGQFFIWFGKPAPEIVMLPEFVIDTLLYGLLGLGAYRTYEKKSKLK